MTQRERFLETMRCGQVDRPPLWEEGAREETLAVWRKQGLQKGAVLPDLFLFDRREMVEVNLNPLPAFRHNDRAGGLARLRACYQPGALKRFPADWKHRVAEWSHRDYPLGMAVSRGLFQSLGVEDWGTLAKVLFALSDEAAEVEATMERVTDLALWALERVLREVALDFAIISEPIASFHAPVISPKHYRRFALPYHRRLVERLRMARVEGIIVETYGQVEALMPLWLEIGINTLWCHHAQRAGMDYVRLRRRYGKGLRLIGGIDATAPLKGKAAIDEALMNTAAPLLEQGGYLPMLDDRVRPNVPYENYRYYRVRLEKLVSGE